MNSINIAFKLNGGLGTYIAQLNHIKHFYNKFCINPVKLVIYGDIQTGINDALMDNQKFITHYYTRDKYTDEGWDLLIDIRFFCKVIKYDLDKLKQYNPELSDYIEKLLDFQSSTNTKCFFELEPFSDYNIYVWALLHNKTRLTISDFDNRLGVTSEYCYHPQLTQPTTYLKTLGLSDRPFITLQRGTNARSNTLDSPKLWPCLYYDELIKLIKNKYPGIALVQVGENSEGTYVMSDTDYNLLGKTSLEELKILLKTAIIHIDAECGMVHLRKAIGGGPSIVLFGQTPDYFFGYDTNINLRNTTCKVPCASLFDSWKRNCMIADKPRCMYELTPTLVLKQLDLVLSGNNAPPKKQLSALEEIKLMGIELDPIWVEEWLSSIEIYRYNIEKLCLEQLYCILFDGAEWKRCPLKEHPAIEYYRGNKEPYSTYTSMLIKKGLDVHHSPEIINEFISNISKGYDLKYKIVTDGNNNILDGAHRASWLYYENGPTFSVETLKIYGDFSIKR